MQITRKRLEQRLDVLALTIGRVAIIGCLRVGRSPGFFVAHNDPQLASSSRAAPGILYRDRCIDGMDAGTLAVAGAEQPISHNACQRTRLWHSTLRFWELGASRRCVISEPFCPRSLFSRQRPRLYFRSIAKELHLPRRPSRGHALRSVRDEQASQKCRCLSSCCDRAILNGPQGRRYGSKVRAAAVWK
jgi:hypothetical protein